jgi:hypothetical protein
MEVRMERLLVMALLALLASSCGVEDAPGSPAPPGEQWFLDMKGALQAGDREAVWTSFSRDSRELIVSMIRQQIAAARSDERVRDSLAKTHGKADLEGLDPVGLAKKVLVEGPGQRRILATDYLREEREGERLIVTFREKGLPEQQVVLVEEDGRWVVDSQATRDRAIRNVRDPR